MNTILLMASIVHCYIGCNTGSPDCEALHVLECDPETGAAKVVQSVKGVEGTTYFQFDKEGKYLYSVIDEKRDGKGLSAAVRFPLDGWKLVAELDRHFSEMRLSNACFHAGPLIRQKNAFAIMD